MAPVPANNRDITKEDEETEINSTDTPQLTIDVSDSDSDGGEEDTDGYQGYQLLPQDPETEGSGEVVVAAPPLPASAMDEAIMQSLDSQDMRDAVAVQVGNGSDEQPASERTEVWNSPQAASASSIPMDADHVEKIRSAMSGFSLPASAQPAWAGQLSDDDWKQLLKCPESAGFVASGKARQPSHQSQHRSNSDKTVDR